MRHTWENAEHLKKCATFKKMRHTSINAPPLRKCGTLGKMRHTWKYAPHRERCATLKKMRHTWKNVPQLKKCCTLGKMRHKGLHQGRSIQTSPNQLLWNSIHNLKQISSKEGILKLLFQQLSQKLHLRREKLPYNRNVNKTGESCLLSHNIAHQCLT